MNSYEPDFPDATNATLNEVHSLLAIH